MGQWWQWAIQKFKIQCWEHQYTYPNGLSKWHICHWNVNHLTNQAQISFHYECSRKPIPLSPSKVNLIPGFLWVRGDGKPQGTRQIVLSMVLTGRSNQSLALSATSRAKDQEKTDRAEQECGGRRCTWWVWEVDGQRTRGNQPPQTSWWQQSFSRFPCLGHKLEPSAETAWGTAFHSRWLFLSSVANLLFPPPQGWKSLTIVKLTFYNW